MPYTPTSSAIKMDIFILERLPEGGNIETIKLDLNVRNQVFGEIDLDSYTNIMILDEDLSTLIKSNESTNLGEYKLRS